MDKSFISLLAAIFLVQFSSDDLGIWQGISLIGAGGALIYFGYGMGYQSGKDRALRDNRKDSKDSQHR